MNIPGKSFGDIITIENVVMDPEHGQNILFTYDRKFYDGPDEISRDYLDEYRYGKGSSESRQLEGELLPCGISQEGIGDISRILGREHRNRVRENIERTGRMPESVELVSALTLLKEKLLELAKWLSIKPVRSEGRLRGKMPISTEVS
jgi:hypothetical protein